MEIILCMHPVNLMIPIGYHRESQQSDLMSYDPPERLPYKYELK